MTKVHFAFSNNINKSIVNMLEAMITVPIEKYRGSKAELNAMKWNEQKWDQGNCNYAKVLKFTNVIVGHHCART